jgi:heat shock protein HtpX
MSNIFKTTLLLTGMTLLLMLAGRAFGGQNGMLMALAFAAVLNFVSYFFSDKIALATYRAQPVGRDDLPRVYNIVERLAQKVSLPMPKVYLIPTDSPNAIAATLAGAITYLASIARWGMIFGGMRGERDDRGGGSGIAAIAMIFLAPFAAMLIQLAVSRSREYGADDTGSHWTGNPYALASALAKIEAYSRQRPLIASPSTAHLFIIAPFLGGMSFGNLFSTHPPTAKRIERLTGRPAEFFQ